MRSPTADAEFRRIVDEVRQRHDLSDVVSRRTKLKPAGKGGRELMGLCCFHQERTPSLSVNDAKGTYYCHGCHSSGDIITFVMRTEGLHFGDALRWLGAQDLPFIDPAERARRAAENEAARKAAIAEAGAVWTNAIAAEGTLAGVYARSRGIEMPLPPSIRYAATYAWRDRDTNEPGPAYPALIGAVTLADELVAIQRIFLRRDGAGKANLKKPKLSLGRVKGGALKLEVPGRRYAKPSEVIITEGPEDALSLAQELPESRVWASLGTAFMVDLVYPSDIDSIIIAGQNDNAGRAAVNAAAEALLERGFSVRTMFPDPAFKDWNDQLRGIRL